MEEEFNAWYDNEHLPERLSIPGFRSARRWVADCKPGEGKYLATYELDSPAVLSSREYLALFKRWACEQTEPGNADPRADAIAVVPIFGGKAPSLPSVLQVRSFAASVGEPRHIAICELADAGVTLPPALRISRTYVA
jgi:hypothetical protein